MQIIIDIPYEMYVDIKDGYSCAEYADELIGKVKNSMALPYGHGRLIDADDFVKEKTSQFCENCDRRKGMKDGKLTKKFVYEIGDAPCRACDIGDMIDMVDDAYVVIPADKGEIS